MDTREDLRCRFELLTPRERECLALVAQHWRTREIARRLVLSPETVDEYVAAAVRKTRAENRAAAARLYLDCGCGLQDLHPVRVATIEAPSPPARRRPPAAAVLRVAVLAAGVVAGLALLIQALGQASDLAPLFRETMLLLGTVVTPAALALLGLTLLHGREAERLAVAAYMTAWVLSPVAEAAGALPLAALDLAMAGVLCVIARSCRRPRLRAAAWLQLLPAAGHVAALAAGGFGSLAHLLAMNLLAFSVMGLMLWSALDDREEAAEALSRPS